jgi:hypothetical protein
MSMVFSQFGNIGSIEREEVGLWMDWVGLGWVEDGVGVAIGGRRIVPTATVTVVMTMAVRVVVTVTVAVRVAVPA